MTGRRCEQKVELQSMVGALAVAEAQAKRYGGMRPYKCDRCQGWHLTKLYHRVQVAIVEAFAAAILKPDWSVGDVDPSEFDLPESLTPRHRAA